MAISYESLMTRWLDLLCMLPAWVNKDILDTSNHQQNDKLTIKTTIGTRDASASSLRYVFSFSIVFLKNSTDDYLDRL